MTASTDRVLIQDAGLVTMEPAIGTLRNGSILIGGGEIIEISSGKIDVEGAEVIDGRGFIVTPGFVNAHMHTWQTALRGLASNWSITEYFAGMHSGLATRFRPEDIGIATLVGALNQINTGTTTLVDWCHNNPTPEHTDAAIDALVESGIRAVFFHGSPKPDLKPGASHYSEIPHPASEIARLMAGPLGSSHGLVSLGMAILGPHYSTLDVCRHDLKLASERGLIASMHQGGGPAKTPDGWSRLVAEGLIGRHVNIVHGNDLSDDLLSHLVDLGCSFSVTPETEMIQGHGHPIVGRLLSRGAAPSLGVDLESVIGGEMIGVARLALSHQRALDNVASRMCVGHAPVRTSIATTDAMAWITIEGARMLGMERKIGSLASGKRADLTMIRADDINLWPVHDPLSTVVMQSSLANIDSVMIEGRWVKRGGRLLHSGLEALMYRLARSAEYLTERSI